MHKSKAKVANKWDSLIVASIDSLPKGVFLLFVTSAKSPAAAAQRKARSGGIPGEVTVVQQYPLNKTTGKALFRDMLGSLKRFPYGDSDCLVQAKASAISRKYKQLSSKDPDQTELRKTLIDREIDEQLSLLEQTKQKDAKISSQVAAKQQEMESLQLRIVSLKDEVEGLEAQREKKESEVDELAELWGDKRELREEIEGMENRIQELRSEYAQEIEKWHESDFAIDDEEDEDEDD